MVITKISDNENQIIARTLCQKIDNNNLIVYIYVVWMISWHLIESIFLRASIHNSWLVWRSLTTLLLMMMMNTRKSAWWPSDDQPTWRVAICCAPAQCATRSSQRHNRSLARCVTEHNIEWRIWGWDFEVGTPAAGFWRIFLTLCCQTGVPGNWIWEKAFRVGTQSCLSEVTVPHGHLWWHHLSVKL